MGKSVTPINTPNKTQYFMPADENWIQVPVPFKASTALVNGGLVGVEISGNTTTGNATVMGAENAAGADFIGILAETIATTDTDYATAGKLKSVWVPTTPYARAKFTVGAGTFTAADVFKTVEITSGALGLSVDTAGKGARITSYINSTTGECQFCMPNTETA